MPQFDWEDEKDYLLAEENEIYYSDEQEEDQVKKEEIERMRDELFFSESEKNLKEEPSDDQFDYQLPAKHEPERQKESKGY